MTTQAQTAGGRSRADWRELEVRSVHQETLSVKCFELAPADAEPLPAFPAGAHIQVTVRNRMGMPDTRPYSLAERGAEGTWRIAVKFEPEGLGGSRFLHETVRAGDRLRCSLPRNDFPLQDDAAHSLLIAGGIGITPIAAMAADLAARKRPFALHYVARSVADMPLADRVKAVAGERATLYHDGGDPAAGLPLEEILARPGAGCHAYICGPEGLIEDSLATARRLGWPAESLHAERFAPPARRPGDGALQVVLARSGRTVDVPAGRSILDALIDAGVDPRYDCRRGACGTCVQKVLEAEGGIDHRDLVLGHARDPEEDRMYVCVSRIGGRRLVLDL